MNPLVTFYNNTSEREAVKGFMIEVLENITVEKAFEGEDVVGIKEAYDTVNKMFDILEERYGKVQPAIISNSK